MFFKMLDLDEDGFLSRSDLNNSAKRFGWSWHEAPLLAVFDLLSISKPIPKSEFIALIHQIHNDPLAIRQYPPKIAAFLTTRIFERRPDSERKNGGGR